jgi:hypothetical protein
MHPTERIWILALEWFFIFCADNCSLSRISLASFRKLMPAGVNATVRVERCRSCVSSSSSRERIYLETADCVILSASAALAKLKFSATWTKLSSCWVFINHFLHSAFSSISHILHDYCDFVINNADKSLHKFDSMWFNLLKG